MLSARSGETATIEGLDGTVERVGGEAAEVEPGDRALTFAAPRVLQR